jgi:hypothetical protein
VERQAREAGGLYGASANNMVNGGRHRAWAAAERELMTESRRSRLPVRGICDIEQARFEPAEANSLSS